jgi:parallel beta-helix repeat protein
MSISLSTLLIATAALPLLAVAGCSTGGSSAGQPMDSKTRTVAVAQSGQADVIGNDNVALQKAADMLRPGDTLSIGEGTYTMHNSLVIPVDDVTVIGLPGRTILKKAAGVASRVTDCGDFGEDVVVVAEPGKFKAGMGISITDDRYDSGWAVSVTAVKEVKGDSLFLTKRTVRDYDYLGSNAKVENKFPIFCGIDRKGLVFEGITVDGNREENPYFLDGCRGGGIYLYRSTDCVIRNCKVRGYNGDGISFQITDNIDVIGCESYENTNYGIHPGTGSPNAEITGCHFHDNDRIGFFLCWRVRYGKFSDNLIENNGLYGISIGHKDTDNLFTGNTIRGNGFCGIYFRPEQFELSGHRNVIRDNEITDNGGNEEGYGIYVDPAAGDITVENNRIGDSGKGVQKWGVYVAEGAGKVDLKDNQITGHSRGEFHDENG